MGWNLLVFVLIFGSCYVECEILPFNLEPCSKSGDQNACYIAMSEVLKPIFIKGIPEWNVPSVDPLDLGSYQYDHLALKVDALDVVVKGYSDVRLINVTFDWIKKTIQVKYILPWLNITADYDADGEIFLSPIWGKGKCAAVIKNFVSSVKYNFVNYEDVNAVEHMALSLNDLQLYLADVAHFDCSGLYDGDKEKSDTMINMLNEKWKEVVNEYMPPVFEIILQKLISLANKFTENVSNAAFFQQD